MDAKAPSTVRACAVCDASDARMLIVVPLSSGESTVLCGSHALMYRRGGEQVATVEELRARVRDRRAADERRMPRDRRIGEIDELGTKLTAAFAGERRAAGERRT
jgi:hypothetical protein